MIGVACLTVAGLGLSDYLRTQQGEYQPLPDTVRSSSDAPSERDPGPVSDEYVVPADTPRAVRIPNLGVEAYVQKVAIDPEGRMATPGNIYFTGWYVGSVAPGEPGVSIINGHAGGRYAPGVFDQIGSLSIGDSVQVQMGDGTWRNSIVTSVKTYSVEDALQPLYDDDPGINKELHLITCEGYFDQATQTYDQRVIVVASFD